MSMEMHVFLHDQKIPATPRWQEAIGKAGFDLTLDSGFRPREDTGFTPVFYRGGATGFEFDVCPTADITASYPEVASRIADRDMVANFRWGSDLEECAAAVIASSALACLTDGILFDPQEGELWDGNDAIALAKQTVEEIDRG
jgi:hypothetical protein